MSQQVEGQFKAFTASEDLVAYRRVRLSDSSGTTVEYADQADGLNYIGVTQEAVSSGQLINVRLKRGDGTFKVMVSEALAVGATLYPSDDGKVADTASGVSIGKALEVATANADIIEALLDGGEAVGGTNCIYVAKGGNDSGLGTLGDPLLTVTAALAAVSADETCIVVFPGEYAEVASLTWPTAYKGLVLTGLSGDPDATIIAADAPVINIDPAARSGTYTAAIANLQVAGVDANSDVGLRLDNGTVGQKIVFNLYNVNISMFDEDTDTAIQIVHADDTTNTIRFFHHGPNEFEGIIALEPENSGDRFYFDGANFAGPIHFGAGAIASRAQFLNCIVRNDNAGGDEGNDAQFLAAINCISYDGSTTYAIVDKEDFGTNISSNFTVLPAS